MFSIRISLSDVIKKGIKGNRGFTAAPKGNTDKPQALLNHNDVGFVSFLNKMCTYLTLFIVMSYQLSLFIFIFRVIVSFNVYNVRSTSTGVGNPAHIQFHVWQLIKEVKQSLVGEEKYTALITWIHLVQQGLKLPEMTPFDLQRWYFSDHKHLFSAFIFVHLTEAPLLYIVSVSAFLCS